MGAAGVGAASVEPLDHPLGVRLQPGLWTMVFPLGIYTAATGQLAEALPLPALKLIPTYFIFVALAAWLLTMVGMLHHFWVRTQSESAAETARP